MNYIIHNNEKMDLFSLENKVPTELSKLIDKGEPIAVVADDSLLLISLISKYYNTNSKLLLVHYENYSEKIKSKILGNGYFLCEYFNGELGFIFNEANSNITAEISLFTSGTTGDPKLIHHTWNSLNTFKDVNNKSNNNWLVTYSPCSYAWYQMVLMFLEVKGQNLIVPSSKSSENLFENINHETISAISSTPSFWRFQLFKNSSFLALLNLTQITLGGEFVDQNILDTLSSMYPDSKISHIYASTEAGANIIVHDKKEGFPLEWLNTKCDQLKLIEGVLFLNSKYSSINNQMQWYDTGDQVKVENDRVVIIGRKGSRIANVGGRKVNLNFIENVIKRYNEVLHCKVFTKKSPIVNNIIVAELILKNNSRIDDIEESLRSFCYENNLEEWMVPRKFYNAINIKLTDNYKTFQDA